MFSLKYLTVIAWKKKLRLFSMKTFSHLIDSCTFLDQFVTSSAQLLPCCQKYT